MSASETKPPLAPKPRRRRIPPPVPLRTHSLKPFSYTTLPPQVIPVQQLACGTNYGNLSSRSYYATMPSSARPVKPPVAPRVSSLMAASGGCTSPRYYGRDEAIKVVMEDITNFDMENIVDDSVSSTSPPLTESSPPVLAVAPMPKPRTAPISPDMDQHVSLHSPEIVEYDLPYQKSREPSIVERIIKSHPIWYLKTNINREIAAHLLSDAEPGNFIIRPSSKPRCAALSVRIPQSAGRMTHHFVIETLGVGKVRLHGSRLSFPSLPSLIEYYHVHGFAMMPGSRDETTKGELLCSLQLPSAILEAHSTEELTQIASIGPAFWNWNNVPPMAHHVSTFHPMDEACTSFTAPNGNGILHKRSSSHGTPMENSTPTRQSWQRASDHKPHYYDSNQWNYDLRQARPGLKLTREGSLNTHTSRRDAEPVQASGSSRRSKSVRETKPREPGRKKSFFGSIFGSQKEQKKRAGTPDLAHCTAFQVDQEAIKRSYGSAFEIGEPKIKSSTYGKSYTHNNGVPTMRTFKPLPGELTNVGRPLPPKPGEMDLVNAASAQRLAKHNEGSPGPPKSPEARKAMRPPGPLMDNQLKQNCLEELRRKRLQTQHEMLNAVSPVTGSPKLTPRSHEKFYRVPSALKSPKKDHRLSVPDLLDLPQPTLAQESARALRERLGRNEIGELGAINEGLITPVVRRKAFPIRHEIPRDINHSSTSVSTTDGSDTYGEQRNRSSEAGYGCIYNGTSRQPGHPSPSVQRKESELIWRRISAKQPVPEPPPAPKSNRSGCIFPDRSGGAWSAIATELTARQAVSKRRSCLMNLDHQIPAFHGHKMAEPGTSEYTHLQDLHDELEREVKDGDHQDDDAISVAGTVFNEPWDSNIWDNLMFLADHKDKGASDSARKRFETVTEDQENELQDSPPRQNKTLDRTDPNISWDAVSQFSTLDSRRKPLSVVPTLGGITTPGNSMMSLPRSRSRYSYGESYCGSVDDLTIMFPCLSPFDEPPAVAHEIAESSRIIQDYIDKLNEDPSTYTFKTISVFIECTRASHEFDPNVVIRNVRQFINGMKNFYQKQGEGELHAIFVDQRNRLSVNHILNFDAIAESILHRILTKKLKAHLYRVKIDRIGSDGYLDVISKNLHMIREFSLDQLGFSQNEATHPSIGVLDEVKQCFKRMSCHYNPMKKVECLMQGIGVVLKTQRAPSPDIDNNPKIPRVEIICRWLVYLFARCSFVAAEIECWYMMELLPKQVLEQGDVTYYLNAMLAAVHLLNNADLLRNMKQKDLDIDHMATLPRIKPPSSKTDIFVKIAIPDIALGNIKYYTFPILPLVPSVKFCRIIAHQQGITNPDCYGLYIVMDGYATPVQPHEFPDGIRDKLNGTGKSFYFAYQQHGSKIAWPCEKIQGEQLQGLNLC